MNLTKSVVDRLTFTGKTPNARCIVFDEDVPGFGVRVNPSGKKVWVFQYWFEGRRYLFKLGSTVAMTPDQARKAAIAALSQVNAGTNPQAERKRAQRGETVLHLAQHYIEKYARVHNKSWAKDLERLELYVVGRPEERDKDGNVTRKEHVPPLRHWKNLKVRAVKRKDVIELRDAIGLEMLQRDGVTRGAPTTANRVLSLLSSMFNQARLNFDMLPQTAPNPCEGVDHFPEQKRRRFVRKKGEAPALIAAMNNEHNLYARAALWAYLLTGLRKEEVLKLRWERQVLPPKSKSIPDPYVDLDENREIYQWDTKAGREFGQPLSDAAFALFDELRRSYRVAGNPYVFVGKVEGRHLVNISKPWKRIKTEANVMDVRIHDLRRTVGSWTVQRGGSLELVAAMLNQSNKQVAEVYGRFDSDPIREGLQAQAEELMSLTGGGVNLLPAAPQPRKKAGKDEGGR